MCNTVPKVIAKLGHDHPDGFTKKELIAAFLADGYGIEKAERHYLKCRLSGALTDLDDGSNRMVSVYCPWHYLMYEDLLKDVVITPVKIERDGSVTRFL